MAGSTSNIDLISSSQAAKEVTANDAFNAASPTMFGARRGTTSSALTWGYYGGAFNANGTITQIANGTLALTASTTCYIEVNPAGTVSFNTTGFTAGNIALYSVVTGASTVTSYLDYRHSHIPLAVATHGATSKTTPVNADELPIADSATSFTLKKLTLANLKAALLINTTGYTVATLPAGVLGLTTYVTDATAPTFLGTLTGGGAVKCPVFYNGAAWVAG
jgi:hypothetical protein